MHMKNTTFMMKLKALILLLLMLASSVSSFSQITIPNATAVTQNFDAMGTSATATLPANWKISPAGSAAPTFAAGGNFTGTNQQASSGAPATGARYNWGTTAATDRALGIMTSGGYASPNSIMANYQNTNADFITQLDITYNLERYRINSAVASVQFYYSLDGTNWTAVAAGDVAAASLPTATSAYNFTPGLTIPVSFSITSLSVANGGDIYLRWNFNTVGANSQGIGIDDVSVTATFAALCSTPTSQASTFSANNITNNGADFAWTNGGGTTGSMVVIKPTAIPTVLPASGTAYAANTVWTSGQQIGGTNNRVVYRNTGTSVNVTALTPGTQYTATVYSYNNPGSCYNPTSAETVTFYTLANEPTTHPGAGTFTCFTSSVSQIDLTFPAANTITNAVGYIILYRIGAAPTGVPTDGAYHAPGTVFGDATVLGQTSISGTDTTFAATGLNAGSTYYFSLIPFGSNLSIAETLNYRTAATIRTTNCTTVTSPEINITGSGQTINPGNTPLFLDNTRFAAQLVSTTSVSNAFVIQNLGNANLVLTGATPYVSLGGANPGDFSITAAATSPIGPVSNDGFSIAFTPSTGGVRTATVTVGSNDATEPTYTFNISGVGDDREIDVFGNGISIASGAVTPTTANNTQFGDVNITTGSVPKTYAIFNTGTQNLAISGVTITGPDAADFTITTSPATSLNQNVSTNLIITFDPTTTGVKNATVTISNNDGDEGTYTFAIQGTGVDYIPCALGLYETIAVQDFEAAPGTPTMTYAYTQEAGAGIVTVGGGTARGSSRTVSTSMFIGTRSFQVAGHLGTSGTEKTTTIDFGAVDASVYQEVSLSFQLGAYCTTNTNGLDSGNEKVVVYISTDNGATWSEEMDVLGNSNSIWDINTASGTATGNFDGNNITNTYTTTASGVNLGPRSITLNNIPSAAQLRVRITLSLDRLDEIWVIDDVKFQGKKDAVTIWNGSGWSNSAPTNTVKAIIDGPYNTTPNGNITTCQCQVNTGKSLNVATGNYLLIQNNLLNSGIVNIASGGSLVQVNNAAANTGSITSNRTASIKKYDYVYWSSPVAGTAVTSVSPATAASFIYKWLPTQGGNFGGWANANETMVIGKGYIIRAPNTFPSTPQPFSTAFTGIPNNGIIAATIERGNYVGPGYNNPNGVFVTTNDDNMNLIGNPYPSAINSLAFLTSNTNIEGAVRIWTHGAIPSAAVTDPFYGNFLYNYNSNDYIVYNGTGTLSGPAGFSGNIASGQGFFVMMNDGVAATESVTFNNAMRSNTYGNSQFYRNGNITQAEGETAGGRIWLDLIGVSGMVNRTLVGYIEGATSEKDRMFDAYGQFDNNQNFYSLIGSETMAIQGRPAPFEESDVVPLGVHLMEAANYKIAIAAVDGVFQDNAQHIYLEDKLTGAVHDLKQAPYDFTGTVGIMDSRFVLRYTTQTLGNPEFSNAAHNVIVVSANQQLSVKSTSEPIQQVTVYDFLGRELFTQDQINKREFVIQDAFGKQQQALVVKIQLNNGQTTTKKVIF